MLPEAGQEPSLAVYRVGRGKREVVHSLRHGGCRCIPAYVPVLVRRIGSNDEKIRACFEKTMTRAGGQYGNVTGSDADLLAPGSTKHDARRARCKTEHLVCRLVVMVISINTISPLRGPSVADKDLLQCGSGLVPSLG